MAAKLATTKRKRSEAPSHGDADVDLREDIRFLGRLLGDTVREQAGAEVFDLVEGIRRTAIRYRKARSPELKQLERTLGRLGTAHATNVVRAFSYFHHLANAAEDLHAPRRPSPRKETIAQALERLRAAHVHDAQDRRRSSSARGSSRC